jgi:hypothetical protein
LASKNFVVDNGLSVKTLQIIDQHGNITANNITGNISIPLDGLSDVDTSSGSTANGSILVYNSSTDKYVQRAVLSFETGTNTYNIDGGEDGF